MPYPTGQEYNDAVQNPYYSFENPELRSGRIETDRLGLPKPRSGNFAVVYKLDSGQRTWAVKCFTREVPDQQKRYDAISAHLRAAALPYTVGFDYLTRGIRLRGQWFPILKMEWVSGEPLIQHIERHLRDPASILSLASRWVAMVKALRQARIAHGDLQHGNVIVVGGDLKLVDYDGMFVPALSGTSANEEGHPNYQHPGRGTLPFGPDLDNFSAWTIYVSLVALSLDSSLWSRIKCGDDCLLFRRRDFVSPGSAHVFQALMASRDERLRSLIEIYRQLLHLRAHQVPPLDAARIPAETRPPKFETPAPANWLEDHVRLAPRTAGTSLPTDTRSADSEIDVSWVLEFIAPIAPSGDVKFVGSVALLRLAFLLAVLATLAFAASAHWIPLLVAITLVPMNLGLVVHRYRREPAVISLRAAQAALAETEGRLRAAGARLKAMESSIKDRELRQDRAVAVIDTRIRAESERGKREIEGINRRLATDCAGTQERRRRIDGDQQKDLARVARGIGARVADLSNQLAALGQDEARESTTALKILQDGHVSNAVLGAQLSQAQIQGVGPGLKSLLIANGITSAQNVDRRRIQRIRGFGPARVSAVLAWAQLVEARARATMPNALPFSSAQAIQVKYAARRQAISTALNGAQLQRRTEEESVRARYAPMRQQIDNLEAAPRAAAQREIEAARGRLDQTVQQLIRDKELVIADAKRDILALNERVATMRRSSLGPQWEKARATAQVKAHSPVMFSRYLGYVVLGSSKAV